MACAVSCFGMEVVQESCEWVDREDVHGRGIGS